MGVITADKNSKPNEDTNVVFGLPNDLKKEAARAFLESLSEKFVPILGKENNALCLLEESMNTNACMVATNKQTSLLGILAIQTSSMSFLNPTYEIMRKHYGFFSSIWNLARLATINHKVAQECIHIEAIVVCPEARGKGIGSLMINKLLANAKEMGKEHATLEVINTNISAVKLYERLGFRTIESNSIWPLNKVIKWEFESVYLMQKVF